MGICAWKERRDFLTRERIYERSRCAASYISYSHFPVWTVYPKL